MWSRRPNYRGNRPNNSSAGESESRAGGRILVVEDEPTVARLIVDVLQQEGYRATSVLDSREGLDSLSHRSNDLVICDLRMPHIDGRSFFRALQHSHHPMQWKVLFITGDTMSPSSLEFLATNHLPFLAKPFLVEELKLAVRQQLCNSDSSVRRGQGILKSAGSSQTCLQTTAFEEMKAKSSMNQTGMRRTTAGYSHANLAEGSVGFARNPQIDYKPTLILGIPDSALANRLTTELKNLGGSGPATVTTTLAHLKNLAAESGPTVIFLDTDLLAGRSLTEAVRELSAFASVVVLASVSNQSEIARFLNCSNVEFIGRVGDFVPLAAALIERQLHRSSQITTSPEVADRFLKAEKFSELFRHEINNPLTGILGNAELVWLT